MSVVWVTAIAAAVSACGVIAAVTLRADADVVGRLPHVRRRESADEADRIRPGWSARLRGPACIRVAGCLLGSMLALGPAPVNVMSVAVVLAAVKAPDILRARHERRRLRRIDRDLPLLFDALSSAALAGLPPRSALHRVVSVVDGPLDDEIRRVVHAVELGARWREQLETFVARCPLPDVARAVGVMSRTDAVGASFAEGMTTLARRARDARRAELARRARTAPVKMLFPLVFLVLPAFLLLTVVPLLVATLDHIG